MGKSTKFQFIAISRCPQFRTFLKPLVIGLILRCKTSKSQARSGRRKSRSLRVRTLLNQEVEKCMYCKTKRDTASFQFNSFISQTLSLFYCPVIILASVDISFSTHKSAWNGCQINTHKCNILAVLMRACYTSHENQTTCNGTHYPVDI